jgi:hypothetical protein
MAGFLMTNVNALPGVGADVVASIRELLMREPVEQDFFPIGFAIDGSKSSDPDNPTGRVDIIRDGMPMGKITATNKYAPSVIGVLGRALTGTQTQLDLLTAAEATELVRRIGTTGTFKITGPAAAAGTVRTLTATYSAVGAGSGVNEVQTATPDAAASSGTYTITLTNSDGKLVTTSALAYNATLAQAQAAVTLALGGVAGCVLTTAGSAAPFSAGPIALVMTFSGSGYAALDQPMVTIDITSLGGVATMTIVETTKGCPVAATVTITALGTNEVQTVAFPIASTGGNVAIEFTDATTGARTITGPAAWSATDATYLSNINTVLDLATGVSGGIVATARPTLDTDYGFVLTFSGTGYAGKAQDLVKIITLPTSSTSSTVTRTTAGVNGAFVAGSLVQPTDGSESIVTLLKTGNKTGVSVFNALLNRIDVQYPQLLIRGSVRTSYIIGYAGNDASTKAYIKAQLRQFGGVWTFDDDYLGVSV